MIKYAHTNIIAKDWQSLSAFYQDVFDCKPSGHKRDLSGKWIEEMTGIPGVHIMGEHLLLPGHGAQHPTLEIFSYISHQAPETDKAINAGGFSHIAFEVDDVAAMARRVAQAGGSVFGEPVQKDYGDMGLATFVYARDPEGNIIELQSWQK